MNKEFVTYEQSIKLKELGFNEPCIGWMADWNKDVHLGKHEPSHHHKSSCSAILKQQVFRWFREKYGLYHFEDHGCNSKIDITSICYWMGIKKIKLAPFGSECVVGIIQLGSFKSYEEAENACIYKLIQLVQST